MGFGNLCGTGNFFAIAIPLGDKFNIKGIPDTHGIFPSESNGWWMQAWTSDRQINPLPADWRQEYFVTSVVTI